MKYGFVKVAAVTPAVRTLDIKANTRAIVEKIIEAHTLGVQVALFPELCVTGYALGDTVFNALVLRHAEDAARELAAATSQRDIVALVGLPVKIDSFIYNCMAVLARGQVAGLIPKHTLTREELRHFTPYTANIYEDVEFAGFVTPVNRNLLIKDYGGELVMGVNHGGGFDALAELGVNVVLQPSTRPRLVHSTESAIRQAESESREHLCGLVYAGACLDESAARYVYDPTKIIAECGEVLCLSTGSGRDMVVTDLDVEKINYLKSRAQAAPQLLREPDAAMIEVKLKRDSEVLDRELDPRPFVPKNAGDYQRVMEILSSALHARIRHIDAATMVVGVSGGLDSATTLLVCDRVCEDYDFPRENVICVTMPCFASGERTSSNAFELIQCLGMTHRHIPIQEAITNHLADIGHDAEEDVAYENAQARERTQILMDIANMSGGIMLGTSDMSEEALGFSTYGGDQLSMFNVNSGLTKTAIRGLVGYLADATDNSELKEVLRSILDTPVSPELKKGQKTEELIGSYEIHDFILYHFLGGGCSPEKILFLAERAFPEVGAGELKKTVRTFFKRFFASQFKRNAAADGVQVFDVFLSPWAFSMNSDISGDVFK